MIVRDQPAIARVALGSGEIAVKTLRSIPEIEKVRELWMRWQGHPNCDCDFFQTVLQTMPGVQRPHVLVAYRDNIPEAMLIGRVEKSAVEFSLGYKKIVSIPARRMTFLHGGYVGNTTPETAREFVASIRCSLSQREADIVYFNHLRADESLYNEIARLSSSAQVHLGEQRRHRGMTLADSAAGFLRQLSSKERNNQKRREKRIQEDFKEGARIETYRFPSDMDRMISDIDRIAKKTYQRALGVGFEDTPEMRARLQMEVERGWLRAFVLYLEDRPCAFWMGDIYSGTFYSGFTGYDSEYSKYAPGMFLLLKALEVICSENADGTLRSANFGLGDAEWKQVIGDLEWEEAPVHLFAASTKGRILSSMQRGSCLVNSFAKKILAQAHTVARVKRVWRSRLSRKAN